MAWVKKAFIIFDSSHSEIGRGLINPGRWRTICGTGVRQGDKKFLREANPHIQYAID